MTITYENLLAFLYREARLLDDKQWEEWLQLYAPDAEFWMPAWDDDDRITEDPQSQISLMYYPDRDGLEDRVFRIGHLGHFNDLTLCGALAGVEMGLAAAGVPHRAGGGIARVGEHLQPLGLA